MVHLLPYERFDLYKEAVKRLSAMADCLVDHNLCKHFENALQKTENQVQTDQVTGNADLLPQQDHLPHELDAEQDQQLVEDDDLLSSEVHITYKEGVDEVHLVQNPVQTNEVMVETREKVTNTSQAKVNKKRAASRKCPWTKYHASKEILKKDKTIQSLRVVDSFGIPAAGLQVVTRRAYKDILINSKENVEEKTNKK